MIYQSSSSSSWTKLSTYLLATLLSSFTRRAHSEFTTPTMGKADLSESWTVGDVLPIAWAAGWTAGLDEQPERVDLWVTQFTGDGYKEKLTAGVSMGTLGGYNWTIDVSDEQIGLTSTYVLRFMNHSDSNVFPTSRPMLPSRGFVLLRKKEETSSSTTTTTTSSASITSSIASSAATSRATADSTSGPAGGSGGKLSVGGVVGGVLGGLVGLALMLVGVLFLLRRLRRRKEGSGYEGDGSTRATGEMRDGAKVEYRYEMPTEPHELYTQVHTNELDSTPAVSGAAGMDGAKKTI